MKKSIEYKFDYLLSFTILMFSVTIILGNLKIINTNFAILNFILSVFPWICLIFMYKLKFLKKFFLYFFLLIIIKTISLISASLGDNIYNFFTNIYYFLSFFLTFVGIYFCLIPNYNSDNIYLKKTCITIIIFTLIFCFYNIYINKNNFSLINYVNSSYDLNFSSFFGNRNNFGKYLFFSNILLFFSYKKLYINKRLFLILVLFINFNLLLSFSRTAIICTIIFFMLNIDFNKIKNKNKIIILPIIIIIIGILLYFVNNNIQFVSKYFIRSDVGFAGRDMIWNGALTVIKQHPILGVGEAQSVKILNSLTTNNYYHNSYLKEVATYGIIDGIIYVLFLLFLFKNILLNFKVTFKMKFEFGLLISLLLYSMLEEFIIFGTGYLNFMYSLYLFCIVPLLIIKNKAVDV